MQKAAKTREAREIFLRMESEKRLSRSVRIEWLLEHFGNVITLETNDICSNQPYHHHGRHVTRWKGISVYGLLPEKRTTKLEKDEQLRIGQSTAITFLSFAYRIAFVIDLSPSSFVIDDLDSVLYKRLISAVIKCLRSLVKEIFVPGASIVHCPTILVSFCAFSPFLCFPNDNVLLQGAFLHKNSLDSIINHLVIRVKYFVDALILFAKPHIKEWTTECKRSRLAKNAFGSGRQTNRIPLQREDTSTASVPGNPLSSDKGFVHSEWSLIFMLRMGLFSVQLMRSLSLAHIVIVTDGVCSVFDQMALQGILAQLRLHSIACSFIQLRSPSLRGPVLGHVGFSDLLKFIAAATHGTFLFEDQLHFTEDPSDPLDSVQRALLTWSFRTRPTDFSDATKNHSSGETRANYVRNKHFYRALDGSLANLLSARLCEGYSVRQIEQSVGSVDHHPEMTASTSSTTALLWIRLSLAWRPFVTIEYNICVPKSKAIWPSVLVGHRSCTLRVEVFIEARLSCSTANLLGERHDPASLRTAISSLNESDTLLLHLNSFNMDPAYWEVPKEVDRSIALFEYKKASQSVGFTERYEALRHSKFVSYWQPLSTIDQYHWQRLMHTHSVRLILTHDLPLPERIFTSQSKGRFGQVTSEMAFNELHAHLRRWASFVLVRDQSYVCFLYDRNGAESPTKKNPTNVVPPEFFLIQITHDLPCAIVRLSFPGCISAQTRGDILCQFTNSLERLRTVRDVQMVEIGEQFEQRQDTAVKTTLDLPSLCIVQKPYERFLVRYRTIPYDLRLIVRLEHTDSLFAKREMILHNALANFLSCRRQVWHFRDVFLKNTVPSLSSLEFILQTLLRLRLNQGFKIAYSRNGIITLLRQICAQKFGIIGSVPVLEQCILFGPTLVENERGEKLPSEIPMNSFGRPRSLQNDNDLVDHQLFKSNEEIIEDEHFGTIESSRSGTMHQTNDSGKINMLKTQIITEVWSEPTGQTEHQKTGDDEKGMEQSRKELLQQNDLIIRTLFTFDQLMSVCNSRLWVEKPYVIKTAKENEESKCDNLPTETSVRFMSDPFELDTLFRHATQRHLIMLPAMGYADGDPHSMTRQSFLLKSLQHELSEFCDVCIETSDEALISSIMAQLKQCQYDGQESDSFNEIDISQTPSCNLPAPGSPTASFSMRNDTEISPSVFSESTNDYGVATIYNQPNGQGSIQFPVSSFQRKKQLNHRSTSVPLLCDEHGQVKQLLSQTKRLTPMKGIDKETVETKPTHAQRLKSASSAIVVAASAQQRQEGQRQRLAQTPSGGFLLGTLTTGECELHPKKLSTPSPAVTTFSNIRQHKLETVPTIQCKNTKTTSVVRTLRVYAKRLNNWRLLIYVMAKDARMCRQMMRTKSTFPVMTFLCDKPQMAKNFVESGTMAKWSLQNFKIETNPEKENANPVKEEHPSSHKNSVDLDIFFLSGSYAAANTVLLDTEYSEYVSLYLPLFNLREHNETVFHRQLFTKAFICSVYACLCQELFVPVSVLSNVLNFCCEPTTIEVGSINEILRNTCTHLATLTNARQEIDAFPASDTVVASSSQMPFALCSSPTSDDSSPSEQVVLHSTKDDHPLSLLHSMNRSSGEETLVMTETESERGLDQDCHNQLDDFRNAFDQLLQSHGFHRVPGLPDYFFYWPKPRAQEDYLLSSMNLPGLEDFVKIPMNGLALSSPPVFGTAPPLEVSRPEPKKASNFTRHSSARNTMNYRGTPAASILEGRRRHTNTMEPIVAKQQAQAVEDTRELRVKYDCSESTASWELDPMGCTVDGMGNSEKSSLAGELLGTESWPLFVQFSVSVQLHNGLSQNVPIGFIPNCFKQIMDRCDISFRQKLSPDQISISDYAGKSASLQLAGVNVLISMDLLTWPLRQHNQQQQQLSHHFSGENNPRILGETFGGSDGSELLSHLRQPKQSGDDEQLFERKVEMLRQIPAEERRLLRKLQRNVQKMMNTEHVLIMSRSFEDEEKVGTLLGIADVIRDEVEVSAGSTNACPTTDQTLARFDMTSKELVLVADQEDGLRRLGAKLNGLPVEYCRLRELPVPSPSDIEKNAANTEETFPFDLDAMLDGTLMLFYTCGVADLEKFARTRHDSIRQIGHSFKHLADNCEKTTTETEEQPDSLADGEVASILAGKAPIGHTVDGVEAEAEDYDEEGDEDEGEEQGDGFCNSSTTADDGTIAEITMPLNDSTEYGPFCQRISLIDVALANQMRQQPPRITEPSVDNLFGSRHNLLKRQQLLHDFWLIVQIEDGGGRRMGTESSLSVNIFFCQRAFLLHEQLFESACRLIDEQIRTVNQEALLERMHQTEECDQLLADHDFAPQLKSHGLKTTGSLDPASVGTATLRSAKNVPGETLARTVSAKPSPIQRPSSLLSEGETTPSVMTTAAVSTPGANHVRDNSLTYSDEDGEHSSELNALARRKFHPGYFACEMVWHHWFSIHPRLQPSRTFGGCNDIGFKALRLGLEVLAVRNRSNMYVYKERNGNVVYLRLHATEESILNNIPGGNFTGWEEEVRKHCHNCILLAVHGVRPPGEEITEQLMNVLQRRLNSRTLEEIQNALLKNAHIRLEWSDIKFIQREPNKPDAVFFFTVPQLAHHHLNAVKYYLSQQMLTFCISPKFREQSGAALLRSKYSGSASITGGQHYFSGGTTGTSRALSLAGTPTLEHHQQQQWTTKGSIDGRESVQHTFVPFTGPNVPSNPVGYTPTFYLVNKPPGEGKRDTGISCLEVRLVDWTGRLMEHIDESRMDLDSRILPGGGDSCDPIQRFARINELIKSVQVDSVGIDQVQPMPNTCALFQFNMWQNGNVGIEELEHRLRICVHQSICDLVTEFALLSAPLFDATLSPLRSKTGSFSVSNNTRQSSLQHSPPIHHQKHDSLSNLKPSSSALPLLQSGRNATSIGPPPSNVEGFVSPVFTTQSGSSAPIHRHNSPLKPFVQQQIMEGVGTDHHPSMTMPLMGRFPRQPQLPNLFTGAEQQQQQQFQNVENQSEPGEQLRSDFVAMADLWFEHVINETKGSPEMSHSVRKFQFRLDCDSSARKIIQVVKAKLAIILKNERLIVCRSTPIVQAQPKRRLLRTLNSLSSFLEPTGRDLGRIVNDSKEVELPELILLAFNEQINLDSLRVAHDSAAHSASIAKLADHSQVGAGSSQCHDVVADLRKNSVAAAGRSSVVGGALAQRAQHLPQDSSQEQEVDEEEEEMRIWRSSHEPMQMFARRMSCVSSLGCWRNRTAITGATDQPSGLMMTQSSNMATTTAPANSVSTLNSRISLSKFLPCMKPFIPRQRLLYLLVRGETINLFLYNYTNDVVAKAHEIVERCILWHNARSRLLREIGLQKMGITHLSTLRNSDARANSYMLLTWMDPETLVNNDYPVDSLTTPDFSNLPRIYAQLLLKLYRFANPAFVAKGISPWPFEDQTQQMLALREDVRSMLNDHLRTDQGQEGPIAFTTQHH